MNQNHPCKLLQKQKTFGNSKKMFTYIQVV